MRWYKPPSKGASKEAPDGERIEIEKDGERKENAPDHGENAIDAEEEDMEDIMERIFDSVEQCQLNITDQLSQGGPRIYDDIL